MVTYLATPSGPTVRAAMSAGHLACLITPQGKNTVPTGAAYACDNAKFGKGWPGADNWWAWLVKNIGRYGPDRCLFAAAPDTVCDPHATLEESLPWLPRIRALGIPAAFVAQDGSEHGDLIPWGHFDVLFIGGSTEWKLSAAAANLTRQARARGLWVHMGRVNTRSRLRAAQAFGCDSVDGTYLAFGPDVNLRRLGGWLHDLHHQTPFDLDMAPP